MEGIGLAISVAVRELRAIPTQPWFHRDTNLTFQPTPELEAKLSERALAADSMSEVTKGRDPVVASRAVAYRHEFGGYTISTIVMMKIVRKYHAAN